MGTGSPRLWIAHLSSTNSWRVAGHTIGWGGLIFRKSGHSCNISSQVLSSSGLLQTLIPGKQAVIRGGGVNWDTSPPCPHADWRDAPWVLHVQKVVVISVSWWQRAEPHCAESRLAGSALAAGACSPFGYCLAVLSISGGCLANEGFLCP